MYDTNYYGGLVEMWVEEHKNPMYKKNNFKFWYEENESIEFSKGNRDYIIGYRPDPGNANDIPVILSSHYKKKVQLDGSIIVTDYSFDLPGDELWKKNTYICSDKTGMTLIEMPNKQIDKEYFWFFKRIFRLIFWKVYW
jgi:hypothetical protein